MPEGLAAAAALLGTRFPLVSCGKKPVGCLSPLGNLQPKQLPRQPVEAGANIEGFFPNGEEAGCEADGW